MALEVGLKKSFEITVTEDKCADYPDPQYPALDLPHVFATPSMINLMELTSAMLMNEQLEEGKASVGLSVDVKHFAATPCGAKVRCESELIEVNGKKLSFQVDVYDENGKVGSGIHIRAIVNKPAK